MARPDQSDYLAHFTSNRPPLSADSVLPKDYHNLSALDKLVSILRQCKIYASNVPWVNRAAVCLTECPWTSLLSHAKQYSPFGIGFAKPRVFAAGGGPAYYVRADHWAKQDWQPDVRTFATPFWPTYRPSTLKDETFLSGKTVDYSHEREWRIPHDFTFNYQNIEFIILDTYEDMAKFPRELKDSIGRNKFLLMDNYRHIELIWPVHRLE
jgi:hypothetical protein